jgi:hypothetical protein
VNVKRLAIVRHLIASDGAANVDRARESRTARVSTRCRNSVTSTLLFLRAFPPVFLRVFPPVFLRVFPPVFLRVFLRVFPRGHLRDARATRATDVRREAFVR